MTRYTVLGSAGFIGSHVVAALRNSGIEPWCPQRGNPDLWEADLGHVIYAAGLTGDYRTRPFEAVEAHVSLLARVIESASYQRIVYLSSTRLYNLLGDGIGDEDRPIPVNPTDGEHLYELSKLLGENLTLHRSAGRGAVARLSYVFSWDRAAQGFLSDWLRAARYSRTLTLDSSPGLARDYIHVDDAAAALIALASSSASNIVNVARGESLKNAEIAALFTEQGWEILFSNRNTDEANSVTINSARLETLGVRTRPVLPLIRGYLAGLNPT